MATILGFLLIGMAIGLIPFIVSIIKRRIVLGIVLIVICAILGAVNITFAIGVAVVGLIILLVLPKN